MKDKDIDGRMYLEKKAGTFPCRDKGGHQAIFWKSWCHETVLVAIVDGGVICCTWSHQKIEDYIFFVETWRTCFGMLQEWCSRHATGKLTIGDQLGNV